MKKQSSLLVLPIAILALGVGITWAKAQLLPIGVQLGNEPSSDFYAGTGVLGESFTQFNGQFPSFTGSDQTGYTTGPLVIGSTGLTMTIDFNNASSGVNGNANAITSLYSGSYIGINSPLTFIIGGLNPNTGYQLAVYSDGTVNGSVYNGGTLFTGAVTGTLADATDPSIVLGANALENLDAITDSNGDLTFVANPTPGGGTPIEAVSGFGIAEAQSEAVPEPSTFAFLLGGLVVLCFYVRRKSLKC